MGAPTPQYSASSDGRVMLWNGHEPAAYVDAATARAAIGIVIPPQGRCTLTTGVAVTTSDVAGATSIYYTPAGGDQISIYNGSLFVPTTFTELTLALDLTSGHTGYHQSGKNFDLFVVNDSGTVRLGTGPAWSSDTARGTGAGTTELELFNGVWVNKNSMTLRFGSASGNTVIVAARQGTLVGSARMTADGQTEDSKVKRFLFNAYNQTSRPLQRNITTVSWSYSTNSFRQVNADTANQIDVLLGLAGVMVDICALSVAGSSTATKRTVVVGIGLDSSTVNSETLGTFLQVDNAAIGYSCFAWYKGNPGLGKHSLIWLEKGAGTDTQTWYGNNSGAGDHNPGLSGSVIM